MKRVTFTISDEEALLVKRIAREKGTPEEALLRVAVWAYVLPFVPHLPAPPLPTKRGK